MIVISGALVLVALVLLVLGLTMTDLDFVYGSIAVSLVSFVFLVIGILQRRGEKPATAAGPEVSTGADSEKAVESAAPAVTTTSPAGSKTAAVPAAAGSVMVDDDEEYDDDLEPGGGPVLIVPGRPRYHVDGCRYLTGKQAEEIDVLDARDDGFTPCGVCKPDEVLEELYGPLVDDDDVVDSGGPGTADVIDEPEPVAPAPTKKAAAATKAPAAAKNAAPAKAAPATATVTAATPAEAAPAKAEAAPAKAAAAPAKAAGARGKVVVIPERGRFHTPVCRFVRDALGTEELTRTQASKQGYQACGVCKP